MIRNSTPALTGIRFALVSLLVFFVPISSSFAGDDAPFSTNVWLNKDYRDPDQGNSVVRFFILTNSSNQNCLVTLGESNYAGAGTVAFCGVRAPNISGGKPGIVVTVFFPWDVGSDLVLSVTVHQNGAKGYGPALLCHSADGC